jgi:hypothetical protein
MATTVTREPRTGSSAATATGPNWAKIAALGGVVFFILAVIAAITPQASPPGIDDSVASITKYYVQHHTGILIADFCNALGAGFLLFFAAALWRAVRRVDPSGVLAVSAALGIATAAAVATSGAAGEAALTAFAAKLGDAALVRAFFDLQRLAFTFVWFPLAVYILSTCLAALRGALLPRWLAWAGFLAVAVMLLGSLSTFADKQNVLAVLNFIGFILFALWTLGTSITLYLRTPTS